MSTPPGIYSSTNSLNIFSQLQNQSQLSSGKSVEQLSEDLKQDIVPPVLLCYFITMVDMNTQNSLDSEMNFNCAYNIPAIALTLGVTYWKYIKDLYKKLSEDVSWKVRQTLAYSIHELATILGTEYTQLDLVPIFDSYIKDVDEVRIGIVANLTKFLRVLSIDYRQTYMPKLNDFLKMDNQRNWRFRNELGMQIAQFCALFPADYLAEYVQPVAFTLSMDKVAEVRTTSVRALVEVLRQFELSSKDVLRHNFIEHVFRSFANSSKWSFRQLFATLCEHILATKAYKSIESFSKDFLPKLLSIRHEKVANTRALLARIISTHILHLDYFRNGSCPFADDLEMTIQYLSNDQDSDVKSYFPWSSASSSSLQGAVATKQQQNESPALPQTSDNNNSLELNNLEIQKNSNFMYNCSELEKIGNSTSSTSSDSNNTNTNTYNQAYDAAHKVNQVEEF
jgi:serine/threonine-protein phosphatase 4 regulatory subunit 1